MSQNNPTITIKLFATLREFLPRDAQNNTFVRPLSPGLTVEKLIKKLRLPDERQLLILINSLHARPGQVLQDKDVIAIFPPIAGG